MGIFGSKKEKKNLIAVFNIGSATVGGALFYAQDSLIPKIIFSAREAIAPQDELNSEDFPFLMLKALDKVANQMSRSPFGAPRTIYCVLSSAWYISQNRIIRLEKNTPFIFNKKLSDSLIEKEIKLFEEDNLSKYREIESKMRILELKNIKIKLNDYEISDPINKKAKKIEMTLFISMAGGDILSKVDEVFFKHFHKREIKFSSFLMSSFAVTRSMYLHQEDFLLIDIGGEVTDISMIKKSVIKDSVSYPIGLNFIIRKIAFNSGLSLDEAKSMFFLYKDGHAGERVKKKIEPIISKIKTEWLQKFQSSLANLSNDISIPATLFITIDQDYASFFAEIIKTEQFNQYTLTESKFKIIFLNTETFHGIAVFENDVVRDPCLIINAVYINRFLIKEQNA